jgi:hypothetical protein
LGSAPEFRAKRPFDGPQQVLDFVGRYTHRVAISNERLLNIDDGHVTFRYKDYRADGADRPASTASATTACSAIAIAPPAQTVTTST